MSSCVSQQLNWQIQTEYNPDNYRDERIFRVGENKQLLIAIISTSY